MHSPDELRPAMIDDRQFEIKKILEPDWKLNQKLYIDVGAQWQWIDKLIWSDDQWREYVERTQLQTFLLYYNEIIAGYYELQFDEKNDVEIAYFGLLPAFIGRGFGGALLTSAISEAWKLGAKRVWVHTCSLDHPAALKNYLARGMKIYRTEQQSLS
jgi:GNAT superfamily N-acetyltransferase